MQEIKNTDSDIEIIKEIYNESFEKPWQTGDFKELLSQKATSGYIISNQAFIMYQSYEKEAEIITIAVRKSSRRQGLGLILLEEMKQHFDKIFLEVNEHNIGALELYKKAGFKNQGIRKKYYNSKDDAILMSFEKK